MIKFRMPLLAVRDVEISKKFYHDLFDQEVVLDLGGNVTFSGGFYNFQFFTGNYIKKKEFYRRLCRSAGF